MKNPLASLFAVNLILAIQSFALPAFPGAQGYGAHARGGRGGKLIFVTRLDDAKDSEGNPLKGTFHWAISQPYPRMILFRTGGTIRGNKIMLEGKQYGYMTIAGQSAPGKGVCITQKIRIDDADEIIIRYVRIRTSTGADALELRTGHGIIVDHVSVGWGGDEQISIVSQVDNPDSVLLKNVTIQRCLIGECHKDHPTGTILGTGKVSKREGVRNLCAHHNLWVHSGHRFPNVGGNADIKVINNIVYNWQVRAVQARSGCRLDHINNYYKKGPITEKNTWNNLNKFQMSEFDLSIYASGNIITPEPVPVAMAYDWDQWQARLDWKTPEDTVLDGDPLPEKFRRTVPLDDSEFPIRVLSANDAYADVLNDAGCNARLDNDGNFVPALDSVDSRYIDDVRGASGLSEYRYTNQLEYPELEHGTPYRDEDNDGMSDIWEINHFSDLVTAAYDDTSRTDYDGDGYYDLEEFLNATNPKESVVITARNSYGQPLRYKGRITALYSLSGRKIPPDKIPRNILYIGQDRQGVCSLKGVFPNTGPGKESDAQFGY
jgi:hypothetical protein